MNKPRQFVPLLKQMLGFYRFGPLPLLIYVGLTAAVFSFSSVFMPIEWMGAHLRQNFWGDSLFVGCCFWWFFLMIISTPLPFQVLGGLMSLEFLFTRAVDRGLLVRVGRVAVMLIALGPLLVNLALSPLEPKLAFDPATPGSPAAAVQARYLRVFPGSQLGAADFPGGNLQLVIRHGTEMFAAWMLWFGLVCIFLVAVYFSVVFTAWQRAGWHHSPSKLKPWLGAAMVNAPAYSVVFVLLLCAALRLNPFEASFLLFAGHPVSMTAALIALVLCVEPFTERNIRKLEFESV
jgi:hypothetical protein